MAYGAGRALVGVAMTSYNHPIHKNNDSDAPGGLVVGVAPHSVCINRTLRSSNLFIIIYSVNPQADALDLNKG